MFSKRASFWRSGLNLDRDGPLKVGYSKHTLRPTHVTSFEIGTRLGRGLLSPMKVHDFQDRNEMEERIYVQNIVEYVAEVWV